MTFQFKIKITGITKPPVWRSITMPANYSFYEFHIAIQVAFGWENYHLFQFSPKGYGSKPIIRELMNDEDDFMFEEALDAFEVKLSEIFTREKQKFTYIYDFGDNWEHSIVLEKVLQEKTMYPNLLAGKGKCPMEDCGGRGGYELAKEILADPTNDEHEEFAEWAGLDDGERWNPEEFDLEATRNDLLLAFRN